MAPCKLWSTRSGSAVTRQGGGSSPALWQPRNALSHNNIGLLPYGVPEPRLGVRRHPVLLFARWAAVGACGTPRTPLGELGWIRGCCDLVLQVCGFYSVCGAEGLPG